jgi:hypothetical protein
MKFVSSAATVAFSAVLAGAVVFAQQTPPPSSPPSSQSTARQPGSSGLQALDGQTVTLTGCVVREADVPGQEPSVVERAGVMQDFVLTNVQVKSASPSGSPSGAAPSAGAGTPAAGGKGMNVKLTNIDNEKMAANLNRQVEVTGQLDVEGRMSTGRPGATGTPPAGATGGRPTTGGERDQNRELAELNVQTVRALNQPCPGAKQ